MHVDDGRALALEKVLKDRRVVDGALGPRRLQEERRARARVRLIEVVQVLQQLVAVHATLDRQAGAGPQQTRAAHRHLATYVQALDVALLEVRRLLDAALPGAGERQRIGRGDHAIELDLGGARVHQHRLLSQHPAAATRRQIITVVATTATTTAA